MTGLKRAFAGESIHHALECCTVQSYCDRMNRVCEQSEAIVQIDDRIVIAHDVEFERSASIHYGGLCGVFCYLVSTSIQVWSGTYLQQDCAFPGRAFRMHDKGEHYRFRGLYCGEGGSGWWAIIERGF